MSSTIPAAPDVSASAAATGMTSWQWVRVFAGIFILVSLALGVPASPLFHSEHWLWFTAFVGANLLQSGLSRWCFLEAIIRKLGARAGN